MTTGWIDKDEGVSGDVDVHDQETAIEGKNECASEDSLDIESETEDKIMADESRNKASWASQVAAGEVSECLFSQVASTDTDNDSSYVRKYGRRKGRPRSRSRSRSPNKKLLKTYGSKNNIK